jgi:ATP-binding cassette, subfamily C, bacterial CydD
MSHPADVHAKWSVKDLKGCLSLWALEGRKNSVNSSIFIVMDILCAAGFAAGLAFSLEALLTSDKSMPSLYFGISLLVVSLTGRGIISYFYQMFNLKCARHNLKALRLGLMQKALNSRGLSAGQMAEITPIFELTEALEGYYARFLPARISVSLSPILIVIIIGLVSPVSALIILFTLLPFVTLMALSGMATASESERQLNALTRLSSLFADRLKHLGLIIAFEAESRQGQTVARAASEVSERTLRVLKMAFSGSAILEFFAAISVALIAVYCGFSLLGILPFKVPEILDFKGSSPFLAAFFTLSLAPEVYFPLRRLSSAYHEQQSALSATQSIWDLENSLEAPNWVPITLKPKPRVQFSEVSAFYSDEDTPIFGPISFDTKGSDLSVLTGATGSGKSTLLRLILGVSQGAGLRYEGEIKIDGQVLSPKTDLSEPLSWMSQHTPILAGTLEDNIRLGYPQASHEALLDVLTVTGLDKLVALRLEGLNTQVNERGSGLSGGERRRIGLARAILKPAPLLILDEPTADLDSESEAFVLKAILLAAQNRTVIVATHSQALIDLATKVVRL